MFIFHITKKKKNILIVLLSSSVYAKLKFISLFESLNLKYILQNGR